MWLGTAVRQQLWRAINLPARRTALSPWAALALWRATAAKTTTTTTTTAATVSRTRWNKFIICPHFAGAALQNMPDRRIIRNSPWRTARCTRKATTTTTTTVETVFWIKPYIYFGRRQRASCGQATVRSLLFLPFSQRGALSRRKGKRMKWSSHMWLTQTQTVKTGSY